MPIVLAGAHDEVWRSRRSGRLQRRSTIEAIARPQSALALAAKTALQLSWKLVLLASVVLAVVCVRVFVFEYTHGGKEVVHKLFDFLTP